MRKALHGQPRRFLAAGLAMTLGVAFVASTMLVVASARSGIEAAVAGQYERADVVVTLTGAEPPAIADAIGSVPGVAAVTLAGSAYAQATWAGSPRPRPLAIDLLADEPALVWQDTVEGNLPSAPDHIAVEVDRAATSRLGVGSTLTLVGGAGAARVVTVVGLYAGSSLTDGGYVMTAAGARAVDPYAVPHEVLVRGAVGTGPDELATAVAAALGPGSVVTTADAHVVTLVAGLTGEVDVLGLFLLGFAVVALVVSAIVSANTFGIVLAQRTRQLALLRCVGAARSQVFGSVLAQAVVLGVVAGAVGLAGGIGLAAAVLGLSERLDLPVPLSGLAITTPTLVAPLVAGLLVAVVAAALPAYRATKVAPVAALAPAQTAPPRSRAGAARIVLALGAFGLGAALLGAGAFGGSLPIGLAGGVLSFLGVLLAGPLLLPAMIRLIGLLPARTSVPARLARLDSVRNPGRTAATSSALLVGVTLIATMTVGAASMERSVVSAMDSQLPVDLVVDAAGAALPGGVVADLAAMGDVVAVTGLRGAASTVDGAPVQLLGVDRAAAAEVVRGDLLAELRDGVALVPWTIADDLGLAEGGSIRIGNRDLVVSVLDGLPTPDVLLTVADLEQVVPDAPLTVVWAHAGPDASPLALVEATEGLVREVEDVEVSGGLAERAGYQGIFEVMLLIATVLLGVAVLIALVGVGNTLSLSVLERAREHGLLRALGLTRAQLAAMLGLEAALMAVAAAVLGLGLGIAYGFAGTMTVLGTATDQVALVVPSGRLVLIVVVAALAGLAASVLPARRAALTPPVAALGQD